MITKLIPQEKLQQLGAIKFIAMFSFFYGFLFLGLLTTVIFIYTNSFSMDYGRLLQAFTYGIFMALFTWFRINKSEKPTTN
jgi:hypothetical protein